MTILSYLWQSHLKNILKAEVVVRVIILTLENCVILCGIIFLTYLGLLHPYNAPETKKNENLHGGCLKFCNACEKRCV
jgi:hypothetical protein